MIVTGKPAYAIIAIALACAAASASAASVAEPKFYVLGSIGRATVDTDPGAVDGFAIRSGFATSATVPSNTHDTGWKLQLGYKLSTNIALEGGYTSLGRGQYTNTTNLRTVTGKKEASLMGLDLVATAPLSQTFSLLAKIGGYRWTTTNDLPSPAAGLISINDSGWDFKLGAGVQYDFTASFGMRFEFERYTGIGSPTTTGDSKVNLVSLGAVLKF